MVLVGASEGRGPEIGKLQNSVMFTFGRKDTNTFLIYKVPEIVHPRVLILANFTEKKIYIYII